MDTGGLGRGSMKLFTQLHQKSMSSNVELCFHVLYSVVLGDKDKFNFKFWSSDCGLLGCSLVGGYQLFRGAYCILLQDKSGRIRAWRSR
jgi:hypothetical protein